MMKPSTVSTYVNSESKAKDVAAQAVNKPSSFKELNYVDIKPWTNIPNPETQMSIESLLLPEPRIEPEVEIKDNREEYTAFTIACKDSSMVTLRLKRQESLSALKALFDIPEKTEDEKKEDSREVIEIFSHARVSYTANLPPNPYSDLEQIWTGLELTVIKKDEEKTYVLMSLGLAEWIIEEPIVHELSATFSADSGNYWNVDTAEIVREKGKGPYVKLNIDKENAVCLKPKKASHAELKRFMTPHLAPAQTSPSNEDEEVGNLF